ncbi:hypothetical protein QVD17_30321 [Tagetes erecta]|uniref:SCP domain-containing protein n=1 Tax=Tagetes erecta TaxID=13708 RepID=A0AAD8NM50_TARER|nr:hypothetical protein QVD17_30321 [Tagetes erecta]
MGHSCNISLVLAIFISVLHLSHAQDKGSAPDDYVSMHNCIRRVLNLKPVTWDEELAKKAQAYAEERKVDCQLIHAPFSGDGENLAMGQDLSGTWATQLWLDERLDYDHQKNECTAMCGHYTQIVWNTTERIGCGKARCNDGKTNFICCRYNPPGNYIGQYPY